MTDLRNFFAPSHLELHDQMLNCVMLLGQLSAKSLWMISSIKDLTNAQYAFIQNLTLGYSYDHMGTNSRKLEKY